jgi:hypothetical protein
MKVGFGQTNITPSYGMHLPGGHGHAFHNWKHDDCWVTAAVFDDGCNRVALVGLDVLSLKRSVCNQAREIIEQACGLAGDNVLFGASHTHAGGPCCDLFTTPSDPAYLQHMVQQMATAVITADHNKEELQVGVGVGEAQGLAMPRRWILKDGRQWSHPGAMPELMDHPQGELDESVNVLGVADAGGNLRGAIVNFTCHGTTLLGEGGTSADWIHPLRRALKDYYGEDFSVVFLQGACGDVTQVDNTLPTETVQFGLAIGNRIGQSVAGETIKLLSQMRFTAEAPVAGARRLLQLPPRQPTAAQLAWAREHTDSTVPTPNWWNNEGFWARSWLELDRHNQSEPLVPCEIQAISLGSAAYAANPSEFFCQLGMDIKRGSPFDQTFVVGMANGCLGYVPTADAYEGGYETAMGLFSKMQPGNGELIVEETLELLHTLA